jgi:hypothetical protein
MTWKMIIYSYLSCNIVGWGCGNWFRPYGWCGVSCDSVKTWCHDESKIVGLWLCGVHVVVTIELNVFMCCGYHLSVCEYVDYWICHLCCGWWLLSLSVCLIICLCELYSCICELAVRLCHWPVALCLNAWLSIRLRLWTYHLAVINSRTCGYQFIFVCVILFYEYGL